MAEVFANPLAELAEYTDMKQDMDKGKGPIQVSGVTDSQKVHVMHELSKEHPWRLVVTYDDNRAKEIYDDFSYFEPNTWLYPARDLLFYSSDIHGNLLTRQRMQVFKHLLEDEGGVVVTTVDGLMDHLLPLSMIRESCLNIMAGQTLDIEEIKTQLTNMGYERMGQVDGMGQFSVRGGILDVFPLTEEVPVRIELWGDEVDSIRSFDAESQRSIQQMDEVTIYPAAELILTKEHIEDGILRLEAEGKKQEKTFRDQKKPEEATQIRWAVGELVESLKEGFDVQTLDAYIRYFCKDTVSFLDYMKEVGAKVTLVSSATETGKQAEVGVIETEAEEAGKKTVESGGNVDQSDTGTAGTKTSGKKTARAAGKTAEKKQASGLALILDEPQRMKEKAETVETEFRESMSHRMEQGYILPGQADLLFSSKTILADAHTPHTIFMTGLDQRLPGMTPKAKYSLTGKNLNSYQNSFEILIKDLTRWKKDGYRVVLLSASRTRASRLAGDLREYDLRAFCPEDPGQPVAPGEIMVTYGKLHKGFEYPLIKFVVITEGDMFGVEKRKKKRKKYNYEGKKISSFSELSVGDYVVHESHGLGIYKGIEKIEQDHVIKDYIKVEYGDGGNLYLPATRLEGIQKYAGADAKVPKLNKLGGTEWTKTKTKVRTAVRDIHWKDEDARNEDLDLIIEESNRMSEMVNDILDYSQLQSGYIRLHPEFFDLAGLAESETSHCAAAAETYGIRIHFESDPESVFITADPLKLSQVLRNLLYNAINHTPEGELITVALKQTGKTVRLSVKNPGTPISKEDQEIIWERYQRSQHQSGRRMGTGIGLSIVSTILDAHGMKYGVSSDDTETVFWFDVTVSAPPDPSLQADKT